MRNASWSASCSVLFPCWLRPDDGSSAVPALVSYLIQSVFMNFWRFPSIAFLCVSLIDPFAMAGVPCWAAFTRIFIGVFPESNSFSNGALHMLTLLAFVASNRCSLPSFAAAGLSDFSPPPWQSRTLLPWFKSVAEDTLLARSMPPRPYAHISIDVPCSTP